MWFGCNERFFPQVAKHVGDMSMVRIFMGDPPSRWPATPRGMKALISIRPDPVALLHGKLDHTLTSLIRSAPDGSYLTAWHEADKGRSRGGLSATHTREVHRHMRKLSHKANRKVRYGAIVTQGIGRTDLGRWVVDGLDFYGVDLYDLRDKIHPHHALHHAFRQLPNARRVVAETNSSDVRHRPEWFRDIYDWLAVNRGHALLTFWSHDGRLSGPWVDNPATIHTMNDIAKHARRNRRV